jgi:hypothetical protein
LKYRISDLEIGQQNDDRDYREAMAQIQQLQHEIEEQCRINGMGGERELKLMAQVEELKRDAVLNQQDLERTLQLANDFSEEIERLQRVVDGFVAACNLVRKQHGMRGSALDAVMIEALAAAEKESAK